jgi:hypothetical protein
MAPAGTVAQIPVDFGNGRSREAGQMKEDNEGIPFHTLLTEEMHRGDRILRRKNATAICSSCFWAILCVRPAGGESGAIG